MKRFSNLAERRRGARVAGLTCGRASRLCARGRFQLTDVTGRDAAALAGAILALETGTLELEGIGPSSSGRRSYYFGQWSARTRARLAACASSVSRGRLRLRAELHGECATIAGTLRTSSGRTRFTARRIPTCGNDVVEDGEACDDGNHDDGDRCSATCDVEPGCAGPCERSADCHPTSPGTCEYLPPATRESLCPSSPTFAMCGCDRRSYRTACDAWAAGVAVVSAGRCPWQDSVGSACPDGYWCDLGYPWYTCDDASRGCGSGSASSPASAATASGPRRRVDATASSIRTIACASRRACARRPEAAA